MTSDQFAANDALDRQRAFNVFAGIAGMALGVDPGAVGPDGTLNSPVGQHQVFSVSTGTAVQGQAAPAGVTITMPMLVLAGGLAYLALRK
jgi:hypothetical protein